MVLQNCLLAELAQRRVVIEWYLVLVDLLAFLLLFCWLLGLVNFCIVDSLAENLPLGVPSSSLVLMLLLVVPDQLVSHYLGVLLLVLLFLLGLSLYFC